MIARNFLTLVPLFLTMEGRSATLLGTVPGSPDLRAAAWTSGHWIAVGTHGTIITSDNGVVWTSIEVQTSADLTGLTSSGSSVVAIGTETWTDSTGTGTFNGRTYASSGIALSSSDGRLWSKHAFGDSTSFGALQASDPFSPSVVAWTGSRFWIAVNHWSPISDTIAHPVGHSFLVSRDGMTWVTAGSDSTWQFSLASWNGNGLAVATDLRNFPFSIEGFCLANSDTAWTRVGALPAQASQLGAVASDTGSIVMVGKHGAIWTSVVGDPVHLWVARPTGVSVDLHTVGKADGWTVVAGDSGTILLSSDNSTWIKFPSGTIHAFQGLSTRDSQVVLVGDSGTVLLLNIASVASGLVVGHRISNPAPIVFLCDRILHVECPSCSNRIELVLSNLDGNTIWKGRLDGKTSTSIELGRRPVGVGILMISDGTRVTSRSIVFP